MKVERQVLHNCLDKAKENFKLGDKDQARDFCDMGIAYIANKRIKGLISENEEIEGVRVDLWLERFWMFLENKKLLLGQ